MEDDYQFEDVDDGSGAAAPAAAGKDDAASSAGSRPSGNGPFAGEIFSKKIQAKFRTFYVDLKESNNGKFIKISEKSHGRKSTIMMDAEDVPEMIAALQEVAGKI